MSLKRHVQTRATVIGAGDTTTLVSLEDWYGGQILAPVDTWIIQAATWKPRQQLPHTQMSVMARLTAQSAEELDLQRWEPFQECTSESGSVTGSGGTRARAGRPGP